MQTRDAKLKYLIFKLGSEHLRVTIIDGQPYIQSNCSHSAMKGMYFPFICSKGIFKPVTQEALKVPEHINQRVINQIFFYPFKRRLLAYHFIKCSKYTINPSFFDVNIDAIDGLLISKFFALPVDFAKLEESRGRFVTKRHLATSLRLSRELFVNDVSTLDELARAGNLNAHERALLDIPYEFEETPDKITDSPDRLNLWLLQNGATDIKAIFCHNKNMAEVLAAFAALQIWKFAKSFLPKYTNNFFHHTADPVAAEATIALLELYDYTRLEARLNIQRGVHIDHVMEKAESVLEQAEQFVEEKIGDKMDHEKKEKFVRFCTEQKEVLQNNIRYLAQNDQDTAAIKKQRIRR